MQDIDSGIMFFIFCIIFILLFLFIVFRKNSENNIDYDEIISELNKKKEKNLIALKKGNIKINEIESQILSCKKYLNMKLFK